MRTMRALTAVSMLLMAPVMSSAQEIVLQVQVDPNITPFVYQWENSLTGGITIIAQNTGPQEVPVVFHAVLQNDQGELVAWSNPESTPVVFLPPFASSWPLFQVIPFSSFDLAPSLQDLAAQTGQLPEGNYSICVDAVHPETFFPVSAQACSSFFVQNYQDCINLAPFEGQQNDNINSVFFQWTPVVPFSPFPELYQLRMVEVYDGQIAQDAIFINPPLLDVLVTSTGFTWPPDLLIEPGPHLFAWTVSALSDNGIPYTVPNGFSVPTTFEVNISSGANCESFSIEYWEVEQNNVPVEGSEITAGSTIAAWPVYNATCTDGTQAAVSGYVQVVFTDTTGGVSTWFLYSPGESFVPPNAGTVQLTYIGQAYCGANSCVLIGETTQQYNVTDGYTNSWGPADCKCVDCHIEITLLINGAEMAPGDSMKVGQAFSFLINADVSCQGTNCEKTVNAYVSFSYHNASGQNVNVQLHQGEIVMLSEAQYVTFAGICNGTCNGHVCSCATVPAEMQVYTSSGDHPPTITEEPPPPENPEFPPEEPPHIPTINSCNSISVTLDALNPVSLGMVLDEPSKSPYPRAVPMRAEGMDFDKATFHCSGCSGGPSQDEIIIEDRMDLAAYQWVLKSKLGSLNDPFRADSIQDIQDQMDSLVAELVAIDERLNRIEERLNAGIAEDSSKYAQRKQNTLDAIAEKEIAIENFTSSLDSINALISTDSLLFAQFTETLNARNDSLDIARDLVDTLRYLLTNPISQEEKNLLAQLQQLRESFNLQKQAFQAFTEQLIATSEQLAAAIDAAQSALDNAVVLYNSAKELAEVTAMEITAAETQLYANPLSKAYLQARRKLTQEVNQLLGNFPPGGSLAENIIASVDSLKKKGAHIVSAPQAERNALHDEFLQTMAVLNSQLLSTCGGLSDQAYDDCQSVKQDALDAVSALDASLVSIINAAYNFPVGVLASMEENRVLLEQQKIAVNSAKAQVDMASEAYEQAAEDVTSSLSTLEDQKNSLAAQLASTEASLGQVEQQFTDAEQQRILNFELHKEEFIQQVYVQETLITDLKHSRNLLADSMESIYASLDIRRAERSIYSANKKEAESDKASLEQLASNYDQLIAGLSAEREQLKNEKEELEKRRKEIEDLLKELKKLLEQLMSPSKTATGPIVYYIPPPLEEVMKEMGTYPRFEKHVNRVAETEALLEVARAGKESLQAKIAAEVDKVSNQLVKYKSLSDQVTALEEELHQLELELAAKKTEFQSDYYEQQELLQEKEESAQQFLDTAAVHLEEYDELISDLESEMESLDEEIETKKTEVDEKGQVVDEKTAQLNYQKQLADNSGASLKDKSRIHGDLKDKVALKEAEIARGRNDVTIAAAGENEGGVSSSQNNVSQLQSQLNALKTQLATAEVNLASVTNSHSANTIALRTADSLYTLSQQEFLLALKELDSLTVKKIKLTDAYEGLQEGKNHWTDVKNKAEQLAKKVEKAQEGLSGSIDEAMSEDETISGMEAEKTDKENAKDKAEKDKKDVVKKTNDSISKKKQLEKEANEKLEKAEKEWKDAVDSLKQFLRNQLDSVTFKVTLELTGSDLVVDHWRSSDGEQKLIREMRYEADRIPIFENVHPSGGGIPVPIPSVCIPKYEFKSLPDPAELGPPQVARTEPRTIALIYQDGRPLWPEWPVIPNDAPPRLAKDIIHLQVPEGFDADNITYFCESTSDKCQSTPPEADGVADTGIHDWAEKHGTIFTDKHWPYAMWEPELVPKPEKEMEQEVEAIFRGIKILPDPDKKKKNQFIIKPGVMLEVTDTLVGVPNEKKEVQARVVTGDHIGLAGEDIEFSVQLIAGESEGWGFNKDTLITVQTDGDGYAKTDFDFGDGFASFHFIAKWMRGDEIMDQDEFDGIAPIKINALRLQRTPQDAAWLKAVELVMGGNAQNETSIKSITSGFPNCSDLETPSAECAKTLRGVSGLLNEKLEYVNGEKILFECSSSEVTPDPEEMETGWFGIAYTQLGDVPEDEELTLISRVEEKYEEVGRPPIDSIGYSSKKIEEFQIGKEDQLFTVVLDEPVDKGEVVNGSGKLKVPEDGIQAVIADLFDLSFNIAEVELAEEGDSFRAQTGTVSWVQEDGLELTLQSFTIRLDSVFIRAEKGAGIGGNFEYDSLSSPVVFVAELDASGNFLGTVSNFPECSLAGFTLEQGLSVQLDLHEELSPPGLPDSFKGLYIEQATLKFPEMFSVSAEAERTALSAKNFSIGTEGVNGDLSLTGEFLTIGVRGFEFKVTELKVGFENSSLKSDFLIGGAFTLPNPMEGDIEASISKSGSSFGIAVTTGKPVNIPRLKTSFMIQGGTGFDWNAEEGLGTLTICGVISSDHFNTITIDDFKMDSEGNISADAIQLNADIQFGKGFNLHVNTVSFFKSATEYGFDLTGHFAFPTIGIEELGGGVKFSPGPSVEVNFTNATIAFDKGPVHFNGSFSYTASEFRGDFEIGIKKIAESGIKGLIIMGSRPVNETTSFNYWYAQLILPVKIPLGQSGLSLLELGGGVGYNYSPPVGDNAGNPVMNESFAFKAIIGIGNTPTGEVFAGRMEMIYEPGKFSLYGKVWLLKMEDNMFGEGLLAVYWDPVAKLDGYVRMFVALPDAEGDVMNFDGKINFLFAGTNDWFIKSEKIEGSFLKEVKANATVDINSSQVVIKGDLGYHLEKKFEVGVTLAVYLDVAANGEFNYQSAPRTLDATASFHGAWDVNIETSWGNADLISGNIDLSAALHASPSSISIAASANVSWNIWIFSGSVPLDLGYSS